jgi:hypothetical protein
MAPFCGEEEWLRLQSPWLLTCARLPGQAAFTEELIRTEKRHDSFLALFGNHSQLPSAILKVEHRVRRIALRKDHLLTPVGLDTSALADSHEESFWVERQSPYWCSGCHPQIGLFLLQIPPAIQECK